MPLFSDIVKRAGTGLAAAIRGGQQRARDWYRKTAQNITGIDVNEVLRSNPDRFHKSTKLGRDSIGKMVMFFYDPKLKKELPFYDRFPLIFPIGPSKNPKMRGKAFLGINMHYLPYYLRAQLMDALYKELTRKGATDEQRFRISWDILKGISRFALVKPCIKMYLYEHVRSRFFIVRPEEWDAVLCLPLERFERGGAGGRSPGGRISKEAVWRDSVRRTRR